MKPIRHCLAALMVIIIFSGANGQDQRGASLSGRQMPRHSHSGNDRLTGAGPLLTTRWGEGCFYNASCPSDTASHPTCLHVPAGSGAIAMAQIMKYYNFPARGKGEHGYPHPKYGIQYANFGNTGYNWNEMPDSLVTMDPQVAQAVYHCGVAQDMNYGSLFSSSLEAGLDTALIKYFGYPASGTWKSRNAYTDAEWRTMLKTELDAHHPVLYSGTATVGSRQQFFIIDGYQGDDSFHVNWGFSGRWNGYYSLDLLAPDTMNFSASQKAIFNLAPSPPSPVFKMDFESVSDFSLTFNEWTVRDLDMKDTYSIENHSFPHENEPMAFICFNPSAVSPSMTTDAAIQPHGGQRFGACFSSNPAPNNDWFISPQVQLGVNGVFSFWIKSYSDQWGVDSYRVAVSTTDNNPSSFTVISGTEPLQTTTSWTRKVFNLSPYNEQKVWIAIQCVSNDNFLLMIDDLEIRTEGSAGLTADFSADKTTVRVGDPVNFTDQSSGGPSAWQWKFQGGAPDAASVQNPANIRYANPGKYDVRLTISNGLLSDSTVKTGYITVTGYPSSMSLDFESLTNFTTQFEPWTVNDVGGGNTYGIQGVTFPGNYSPIAYICFNPAMTSPPLTNMTAHSGERLGCSFSTTPPNNPNNKWLISPRLSLGVDPQIEFWVQSYNNYFGDEMYNVAVTTAPNTNPSNFLPLTSSPEIAPAVWTKKSYNLSGYNNQDVYIGIQCVTNNGFIFMIDDISVTSTVGVSEPDAELPFHVYPNPASDHLFIRDDSGKHLEKQIFLHELTGKTLRSWVFPAGLMDYSFNVADIPSGLYILRIRTIEHEWGVKLSIIH